MTTVTDPMKVQRLKSPPTEALRFSSRVLTLEPGLHGIRYTSMGDDRNVPSVMIQALPADSDAIDHMPSPGTKPGCLTEPGQMLVLRASRSARIVATIVATASYLKNDNLQLKVERLDQPVRPRIVRNDEATAAPTVVETVTPAPRGAQPAPAAPQQPQRVEPLIELIEPAAPATPARPAATPVDTSYRSSAASSRNTIPVSVGILGQGARAWRSGSLSQLPVKPGEVVVGLRAAPEGEAAYGTQLRLTVMMNDGRTRESVGQDVRIEAMGSNHIVAATLLARTPASPDWAVLGQLQFGASH